MNYQHEEVCKKYQKKDVLQIQITFKNGDLKKDCLKRKVNFFFNKEMERFNNSEDEKKNLKERCHGDAKERKTNWRLYWSLSPLNPQ